MNGAKPNFTRPGLYGLNCRPTKTGLGQARVGNDILFEERSRDQGAFVTYA